MIFSEKSTNVSSAFVKAWGELQSPKHNCTVEVATKSGGKYTFDYTDLDGILNDVQPILAKNELSLMQNAHTEILQDKLYVSVETMLLHSSGEWIKSEPLRMNANLSIQDMGGQITYMKRYSLSALLGIATEKDDDANAAEGNVAQHTKREAPARQAGKLSEAQVNRLFAIAKSHNVSAVQVKQGLMKYYNKTQVAELTKQEYDEMCNRIENASSNKGFSDQELDEIDRALKVPS